MKNEENVIALVAPTYRVLVENEDWSLFEKKLKELGITECILVEEEIGNMIEQEMISFLECPEKLRISANCPMITEMIRREYPELTSNVSDVPSPVALTAERIRKSHPESKLIFVGPCHEKRLEKSAIDEVITFSDLHLKKHELGFAKENSGNVGKISEVLKKKALQYNMKELKCIPCSGVNECREILEQAKHMRDDCVYIEAYICAHGCAGRV